MKLHFGHSRFLVRMIILSICLILGGTGGVILDRGVLATFVP